ncbi:MAG: FAD-dependent oxidoreductase, partial [Nannocystaceae bacterium]
MSLDIAIIGGGAAGMICAHLLDASHRVTVFEKQAILGGNIRTLGGNVVCPKLPANLVLDAGVIEFCSESFPVFHRLLDHLGIVTHPVLATTGCLRADGRHDRARAKLAQARLSSCQRLAGHLRLLFLTPEWLRFRRRAAAADPASLYAHSLSDFLESGPMGQWLRLLMVYAYSIPRAKIDNMPAALTLPTLLQFTGKPKWTSLPQGVYSYIEAITQRMRGRIFTEAEVSVRRQQSRVVVARKGASPEVFDRVIVAATPGQVLNILADPTPEEQRRFTPWQDNRATA